MNALPSSPASCGAGQMTKPLPEHLRQTLWRGCELAQGPGDCLSSGFAALDAQLPGGGWPRRMLSELLLDSAGSSEWRLLGPALGALLGDRADRPGGEPLRRTGPERVRRPAAARPPAPRQGQPLRLLLINPPFPPHLPGLLAHGIRPEQLVWLDTADARQALWVSEQAIKAGSAAALLAWLPDARPEQIRRLQTAALGSPAPVFVLRPAAAAGQSSAAPLRLLLRPGPGSQLQIELLKRRGPAHAGLIVLDAPPPGLPALLPPQRLLRSSSLPTAPVHDDEARPPALARAAAALQP